MGQLWDNKILICALAAWAAAQLSKTVIYAILNRDWNWRRLFGDGGMPSGHSATVSALAAGAALQYGLASFQFAVCFVLAIIVMHDAMGVRQETGKQAKLLTEITDILENLTNRELAEENLKLFVGHTPLQVVVGSLLGILIAFLIC